MLEFDGASWAKATASFTNSRRTGCMRLMKKDMAGAAIVLGLAQAIMDARLPVRLQVLLPLVENAVSGNAMRPLDIVRTRKALSVEIGNTGAEGQLILCDALAEASAEKRNCWSAWRP
jgi:leucyl aminopeptidase